MLCKELMAERNQVEQELDLKKRKVADNLTILMSND